MSQIPSNNSSHTTKKKGRKNTKFNTHENTFSPVSGLDMIPRRAIPQLKCQTTQQCQCLLRITIVFLGVRSFCIDDILSHKTAALQRSTGPAQGPGIVRPWDQTEAGGRAKEPEGERKSGSRRKSQGDSPLDALFNMASNFEAMKAKSGRSRC